MHNFVHGMIRALRLSRHNPDDRTLAQIAIMPMKSAIDTSAAASSMTMRIMLPSLERTGNIVHDMF